VKQALLARHGESEYSARGALNGDVAVAVSLTARGREEARRLGEALRDVPIALCIFSEFQRVRETVDEALRGRDVPRLVLAELNDPRYGDYEGASIDEYRRWAAASPSSAAPGERGESRHAIVARYAAAFQAVLARPEETILVVAHSLPIAYALAARDGAQPAARMPLAEHATAHAFSAEELRRAVELLDRWVAAPTW
jgi:broad specificity phosphatase PhoE